MLSPFHCWCAEHGAACLQEAQFPPVQAPLSAARSVKQRGALLPGIADII